MFYKVFIFEFGTSKGVVKIMEKLLQEGQNQKRNGSFFINYKFPLLIIFLSFILLCALFAFKSFGKTTQNVNFELVCEELSNDIKSNEIAEIEVMKSNNEFEPIVNNKLTVNKGESVRFRVGLKDGYESITKNEGLNYLVATNISKSFNYEEEKSEDCVSYFNDGYFEWTTDSITEDRNIEIKGMKIIDLNVAEPNFVTSEGEILDKSKFIGNWQNTFKYDNKYRFNIDLNEEMKPYELKSVIAETVSEGVTKQLSCEISEEDAGKHEITLYDHSNRFGGIRSSVSKIEVTLEKKYEEDKLFSALAEGEEASDSNKIINFKAKNDEGDIIDLTADQVEIYIYTGTETDLDRLPSVYDSNDFTKVSNNLSDVDSKKYLNYTEGSNPLIFYLRPIGNYSESYLEVFTDTESLSSIYKGKFKAYKIDITEITTDIYIKGFALNCDVNVYKWVNGSITSFEELDSRDDVELYVYEGTNLEMVYPLDENETPKEGVKKFTKNDDKKYLKYLSGQGKSFTFFVKYKGGSYDDVTLKYDGGTIMPLSYPPEITETDTGGFKKYKIDSLDGKESGMVQIDIEIVKKCKVEFKGGKVSEGNYSELNSDRIDIYIYKGEEPAPETPTDFNDASQFIKAEGFYHLAECNKDLTFYLVPKEGYTNSVFEVKKGEEQIKGTNNKFSITVDDTSEMVVNIEGIELNEYKVIFNISEKLGISELIRVEDGKRIIEQEGQFFDTVNHGETYSYNLELNTGYNSDNFSAKDKDGNSLKDGERSIKLNAVKSDIEITITGIELNEYTVTFKFEGSQIKELRETSPTEQVLFTNSSGLSEVKSTITHGKSYEYKLIPADGYRLDECNVTGDGTRGSQSTEDELIINLDNVTKNSEVNISNILIKQCQIEFLLNLNGEGTINDVLDIKSSQGSSIVGGALAPVAEDFKFYITIKDGYDGQHMKLKVNDNNENLEIKNNTDSEFTVTSDLLRELYTIDKKCIITISDIYKLYDVELRWDSKYDSIMEVSYCRYDSEYSNSSGNLITITNGTCVKNLIPHGQDFQFTVKVRDNEYRLLENELIINKADIEREGIEINYFPITTGNNDGKNVREYKVILKKVNIDLTEENSSYVKIGPSECTYNVRFDLDEEIKGKVIFYESNQDGDRITTVFNESVNHHKIVFYEDTYILLEVPESCEVDSEKLKLNLLQYENEDENQKNSVFVKPIKSSNSSYLFKVHTNEFDPENGKNITIKVEGISVKTFKIDFFLNKVTIKRYENGFSDINKVSYITNNAQQILNFDENLYLEIIKETNDDIDILNALKISSVDGSAVRYDPGISEAGNYRITIYNVRSHLSFTLDLEQKFSFLKFNNVEGLSFYLVSDNQEFGRKIIGTETLERKENTEFNFGVKADAGYDLNSAEITIKVPSGAEPTAAKLELVKKENDYHIYKISGIESADSIEINSTIKVLSFNIKFVSDYQLSNAGEGENKDTKVEFYNVSKIKIGSEGLNASYGENVEFSIKLEDRCSNSDIKVKVYKKNSDKYEELNLVNGKYQILNVYENLEVRVEGLSLNQYVLNFVDNIAAYFLDTESGNSFSGTKIVNYGKDYEFKLVAKTGYVLGDSMAVNIVSSNGMAKELKPTSSGIYKITNITEGYTITIENVENIIYSVNFTDTAGVIYYNDQGAAISGEFKVKYGQNFEFSVGIEDAYDESISNIYILVNDGKGSNVTAQKLASGRYLIQNITEDITIKVGNVVKNKYVVTLTDTEGIDYYSSSGSVIKGDNQVEYGEDFYFKVKLYPAYADSQIKVMLGNQELSLEDNMYKVPKVIENKTVTVVGVEKTKAASLINKIETLPSSVNDANDMDAVIEATRIYNSLNESQKSSISNYGSLKSLQESMAPLNHIYNGVEIEGLEWYVKIVANPILADIEACARIYEKLNSEYILSLYDVYLWDVVNDKRYTLPEGQTVVVKFPTPDMTYFESPTGIHENSNGKVDFLTLNMSNNVTSLETSSFSPMGIVAKRSNLPGRSSLIDSLDANLSVLTDYTLNSLSGNSKNSNNNSDKVTLNNSNQSGNQELDSENGQEKSDNQNIGNTRLGSALKLVLILVILGIIATGIYVFMKNRKNKDDSN